MATPNIRCRIVEIICDHGTNDDSQPPTVKELLPWADPFIAQLVTRYRMRAALDDSLRFLTSEACHAVPRVEAADGKLPRAGRFGMPLDEGPGKGIDPWPW